ncbi:RES family NAD+ phosphorylase [Salmonella enterica]
MDKIPFPPTKLKARLTTWLAGTAIERIHSSRFTGKEFNPGFGDARFSPIKDATGKSIPTLYGGENIAVAIMETILHDLPTPSAGTSVKFSMLEKIARSRLIPRENLLLVDLNPRMLKQYGSSIIEVLNCDADKYSETRKWAEKIHQDNPLAHGLLWASKQHGGRALMLFGDRLNLNDLIVIIESEPASLSDVILDELTDLADEMALILEPDNLQ